MDFQQDNLLCQNYATNMAYSLSPPESSSYSIYVDPRTGYGSATPNPDFSGVARAINTVILYNSCMGKLGWREVKDTEVKQTIEPEIMLAKKGWELGKEGKYQEAIESYKQAIRIKPDYEEAHVGLGYAYLQLGMWKEAIEICNEVIKLNPKKAEFYGIIRGMAYCILGNYQEALKDFDKAIELDTENGEAYAYRGIVYARLGDRQKAVDDLNKALELKQNIGVYYDVACIYSVLEIPDKACHYLNKAVEGGYKNFEWIEKDKDFDNIRNETCYQEIMRTNK